MKHLSRHEKGGIPNSITKHVPKSNRLIWKHSIKYNKHTQFEISHKCTRIRIHLLFILLTMNGEWNAGFSFCSADTVFYHCCDEITVWLLPFIHTHYIYIPNDFAIFTFIFTLLLFYSLYIFSLLFLLHTTHTKTIRLNFQWSTQLDWRTESHTQGILKYLINFFKMIFFYAMEMICLSTGAIFYKTYTRWKFLTQLWRSSCCGNMKIWIRLVALFFPHIQSFRLALVTCYSVHSCGCQWRMVKVGKGPFYIIHTKAHQAFHTQEKW